MSKLYPLGTKIKQNFVMIKTSQFIFTGLKSKFVIFIETKNLFNTLIYQLMNQV